MKKIFFLAIAVLTGFTLGAQPHQRGLSAEDILEAVPSIADKTMEQLTISEHLAVAAQISLENQKNAYVHRAAMASFVLPGLGQLKTGEVLPGVLHLSAEAVIIGGTLTGLYFLVPADLQQWNLTREERHNLMRTYMTPERIGEILPAAGVAAGGFVLSVVNSIIASNGAADHAQTNIDSGDVTFEPYVNLGSIIGIGGRLRWR